MEQAEVGGQRGQGWADRMQQGRNQHQRRRGRVWAPSPHPTACPTHLRDARVHGVGPQDLGDGGGGGGVGVVALHQGGVVQVALLAQGLRGAGQPAGR